MFWKLQLYAKHIQSRLLFTRLAYEGGAPDCSALLLLDSCLDSKSRTNHEYSHTDTSSTMTYLHPYPHSTR